MKISLASRGLMRWYEVGRSVTTGKPQRVDRWYVIAADRLRDQ